MSNLVDVPVNFLLIIWSINFFIDFYRFLPMNVILEIFFEFKQRNFYLQILIGFGYSLNDIRFFLFEKSFK